MKVVSSGIDSLVVGFSIGEYRHLEAFDWLRHAKEEAQERLFGGKGVGVAWFEVDFVVSARGAKGYEWVLENGDLRVCVAEKANHGRVYPEVYVTFRANYLWRTGYVKAVNEFRKWLETWAVVTGDRVSRCDICMDMEMDMPEVDLAKQVLTRARDKVAYCELGERYVNGGRVTGYRIGSGAVVARIYDKTLEVAKSQKEWFRDIWLANGWDGKCNVTRVEFQARRDFLKEISVDSFSTLCDRVPDMWRYYTGDWLTIRVQGADSHRHRWAVADWWREVQSGFTLFGEDSGVLRYSVHSYKYERLMIQAKGVLASATAAAILRFGVEEGCLKVADRIETWFNSPGFDHAVVERIGTMASFPRVEGTDAYNAGAAMVGDLDELYRQLALEIAIVEQTEKEDGWRCGARVSKGDAKPQRSTSGIRTRSKSERRVMVFQRFLG